MSPNEMELSKTTMSFKPADQVVWAARSGSQVLGWLVIDSTVAGRSCGGLRLTPDVSEQELRHLARSMTLKFGFLGLPQGGAKAGVIGDPEASLESRRDALGRFAAEIAPLLQQRRFRPHADMGTTDSIIRSMLTDIGAHPFSRELQETSSGFYTAVTVMCAIKQAFAHLGLPLSGRTVAIEGFGSVGRALAGLVDEAGATVVAISTSRGAIYQPEGINVQHMTELVRTTGSRVVEHVESRTRIECRELLELPVDILCPCAQHETINEHNQDRIAARVVCAGANNPITPEAQLHLEHRGVLCLPDFVSNCGGVLGGTLEYASVPRPAILRFVNRHIAPRITWLLEQSSAQGESASQIAARISLKRFAEVRTRSENGSPFIGVFGRALEMYRRGLVPPFMVSQLSQRYVAANLAGPRFE